MAVHQRVLTLATRLATRPTTQHCRSEHNTMVNSGWHLVTAESPLRQQQSSHARWFDRPNCRTTWPPGTVGIGSKQTAESTWSQNTW